VTIAFVRHGETAANRDGVLLGRADPPLTDLGTAQAGQLASRFADRRPDAVVSSPLRRSLETAAAIGGACGLEVVVDDRLIEIDYGAWDLAPFSEIPRADLAAWRADPDFAPPDGESLAAVSTRVAAFCVEHLEPDRTVVAVSHVSPIKAGVSWAIATDPLVSWRLRLEVASISRIAGSADAPVLVSFNETAHL